jgi:lipopolysaccharide transport system ATP-binding protein
MSEVVISAQNISKAYRIWEKPAARLTSPLLESVSHLLPTNSNLARRLKRRSSRYYRDFWALRNVDFEVKKGESVGIIGRNGSGKSTLLQIIAGTLQPTSGSIAVAGRVAALLELGSGFNPDFTGRENVFLNAAVLGFSRAQTEARYAEIVEFADIGDFLDQPVKTYSSGMVVRLAFSVAIAVRPDVLIIDEALAVGDAAFQRKCFRRIEELRERGCTFLFVSHDLNAVTNLCHQALLLDHGQVLYWGEPQECGNRYQQLIFGEAAKAQLRDYGDGGASFVDVWLEDAAGVRLPSISGSTPFRFCYQIEFAVAIENPVFGLRVTNVHGVLLVSTNTLMLNRRTGRVAPGDKIVVKWEFTLPVVPGFVFFSAGCSHSDRDVFLCRKVDVLKAPVTGPFDNAGLMNVIRPVQVSWLSNTDHGR